MAVIFILMISKILVANRGEIAIRVIRTCREMGIKTVAVYSEADRTAPHVLKADEACFVGPSPSSESYLNVPAIFEALDKSGADAVHPGYGFLSENAQFARKIMETGIIWIGPSPEAIITMGDKMAARTLAQQVDAPIVPGTTEPVADTETAARIADKIGYPVLVKAAGGGGGKGMRIVHSSQEIQSAVERARSEAMSAFSDDRVYIEKYLEEPHHIEIQVLADDHGNAVSLGERECSVQRRYQKIIEETPSPFITNDLRRKLNETALNITRACDYRGAGTVEFLVDKHRNFYFLEMNTRLQVEHPITEMVNSVDLVKEQIRVAEGRPISFRQEDIRPRGHSIECRIYAEDGFNGFSPSIGRIIEMDIPQGPGVRMDEGVRTGQEVTPYYDPMLGKLVTWGNNREEALRRMDRALSEFHVVGIETSIPFCLHMIRHESFTSGNYCTHTLNDVLDHLVTEMNTQKDQNSIISSIAAIRYESIQKREPLSEKDGKNTHSRWLTSGRERNLR